MQTEANCGVRVLPLAVLVSILTTTPESFATELEEVVVTARKREESIMKVPVVASVLSDAQIEQYGQGSLYDFADRVPGLTLGTAVMSIGTQVSLRGIGTAVLNTTMDQSVSLNVDGMQMTQGLAYGVAMFDVRQVEVLKGPQALYYGKAAPAGVIAIESAMPGNRFELDLRHGFEFEAQENRSDFIISGPVSETLGLRLAARYVDGEGWMKNEAVALAGTGAATPTDRDFPSYTEWTLRGTADWHPSERLSAVLKLNWNQADSPNDGGHAQLASCPDGTDPVPGVGIPFIGGGEDCKLDDTIRAVWYDPAVWPLLRNHGVPFRDARQAFGTISIDYDFNPALRLSSVTGYYDLDQSSMINSTVTSYAGTPIGVDPDFNRSDFTQEFRLSSDFRDRPINFTFGAFYQDSDLRYDNKLLGNQAYGLPTYLNKGYQLIDIKAKSAFGQLIWTALPQLELAGGVRYTDERRHHRVFVEARGSNTLTEPTPSDTAVPRLHAENWSPEFTATWTPSDTLSIFGSLKRAYKSGSFDSVTIPAEGADVSFGDEKVTGGELGFKSRWMGNRLSLDAATYYYDYKDMQVGANFNSPDGLIIIRTLNAASAKIYGAEASLNYIPAGLSNLELSAAANYNIAEFDTFDNAQCWGGQLQSEGCNLLLNPATGRYTAQDLSGNPQMRAPKWSGYVSADYLATLGDGYEMTLGWYTSYSSRYLTNLLARDDMWQDAYFVHNASVALHDPAHGWTLSLIGNNLANELVAGNCQNSNFANGAIFGGTNTGGTERGPAGIDELSCDVVNRRSLWLRLELSLS